MDTKLLTTSSSGEIKAYFTAILNLTKQNNQFSVNLDDVWRLVYSEKSKAVRALKNNSNFMQDVDY